MVAGRADPVFGAAQDDDPVDMRQLHIGRTGLLQEGYQEIADGDEPKSKEVLCALKHQLAIQPFEKATYSLSYR